MITCPFCHLEFSEKPSNSRSVNQNNYYFGVIVKAVMEDQGMNIKDAHELLKAECNFKIFYLETPEGILEKVIVNPTKFLTTVEFEDYARRCREWACNVLKLYLPLPNEEVLS